MCREVTLLSFGEMIRSQLLATLFLLNDTTYLIASNFFKNRWWLMKGTPQKDMVEQTTLLLFTMKMSCLEARHGAAGQSFLTATAGSAHSVQKTVAESCCCSDKLWAFRTQGRQLIFHMLFLILTKKRKAGSDDQLGNRKKGKFLSCSYLSHFPEDTTLLFDLLILFSF